MNAPEQQNRLCMLSRLYDMKQKQLSEAVRQGNHLRCQVLEAEAHAILDAIKIATRQSLTNDPHLPAVTGHNDLCRPRQ